MPDESDTLQSSIKFKTLNHEIVFITNLEQLRQHDDSVSMHIDSILMGYIDAELISTGYQYFDLTGDKIPDIAFEIIDLNRLNPQCLPESFDSLAARVVPLTVEVLDNSGYGYPDAFSFNDIIEPSTYYNQSTGVLGTFMNAGNFQGKGQKYLPFRYEKNYGYCYGWIEICCSQHNDTLQIVSYAVRNSANYSIFAGQVE